MTLAALMVALLATGYLLTKYSLVRPPLFLALLALVVFPPRIGYEPVRIHNISVTVKALLRAPGMTGVFREAERALEASAATRPSEERTEEVSNSRHAAASQLWTRIRTSSRLLDAQQGRALLVAYENRSVDQAGALLAEATMKKPGEEDPGRSRRYGSLGVLMVLMVSRQALIHGPGSTGMIVGCLVGVTLMTLMYAFFDLAKAVLRTRGRSRSFPELSASVLALALILATGVIGTLGEDDRTASTDSALLEENDARPVDAEPGPAAEASPSDGFEQRFQPMERSLRLPRLEPIQPGHIMSPVSPTLPTPAEPAPEPVASRHRQWPEPVPTWKRTETIRWVDRNGNLMFEQSLAAGRPGGGLLVCRDNGSPCEYQNDCCSRHCEGTCLE